MGKRNRVSLQTQMISVSVNFQAFPANGYEARSKSRRYSTHGRIVPAKIALHYFGNCSQFYIIIYARNCVNRFIARQIFNDTQAAYIITWDYYG